MLRRAALQAIPHLGAVLPLGDSMGCVVGACVCVTDIAILGFSGGVAVLGTLSPPRGFLLFCVGGSAAATSPGVSVIARVPVVICCACSRLA